MRNVVEEGEQWQWPFFCNSQRDFDPIKLFAKAVELILAKEVGEENEVIVLCDGAVIV